MQISFRMRGNSQQITLSDLNSFESMLGMSLPQDYREHMLAYNGGIVEPMEIRHINYEGNDQGISYFFPIKYGSNIMEEIYTNFNGKIPNGYIVIGVTRGQGRILLSLNNDNTYGKIVEWYPDGELIKRKLKLEIHHLDDLDIDLHTTLQLVTDKAHNVTKSHSGSVKLNEIFFDLINNL